MAHNLFDSLQQFTTRSGAKGRYYALHALEKAGVGKVSRLPVSIRIVLESVLRNCDGKKVTEEHVRQLAAWGPNAAWSRYSLQNGTVSAPLPWPRPCVCFIRAGGS